MKRILAALVLAALTGCAVTPSPKQPPMPPLPTALKSMKTRTAVVQAQAVAGPVIQAASLEPWVPEKLYIEKRASDLYLGWMTNISKVIILSSTNITTPMVQWQILSDKCRSLEGDHWIIQITNRYDVARFYRLLSVPTNSLTFGWSYAFGMSPTADSFGLLEGPASHTYTNTTPIPGKVLWAIHPVAQTTNTTFYAVVAVSTNGVQSVPSNEVYYRVGDTNNPFSPPCP